jgi:hypothetical protein
MYCKLLHLGPRELDWDGRFCGGRLLMVKREWLGLSEVSLFYPNLLVLCLLLFAIDAGGEVEPKITTKTLINSHGG